MASAAPDTAEDDDRKRRRPVVGALLRANRIYSGYSWAHRIASWLFGATSVAVVGATTGMLAYDVAVPAARVVTAAQVEPEEALVQRLGERSQAFSIVGFDERGRRAAFDVIVLDKSYTWMRGATDQLAENDRPLPVAALIETVLGGAVKSGLEASRGVIAVGVASQEGEVETETRRAGARAEQTAKWLRTLLGPAKPLWTLNLGQYRETGRNFDAGATSWQRPFIVIAINSADNGIDMSQALNDAMRGKTNLASPDSYTSFDLEVVDP